MKKIDMPIILLFCKKNKVLIRLWGNDHNRVFFGMKQTKERIFRKINYINNSKVL